MTNNEPTLFPGLEPMQVKHWNTSVSERKVQVLNLHLLSNFKTEGHEQMPKINPYNGSLPVDLIPFSDRNHSLYSYGIHCYLYDYNFELTWNNPQKVLHCLQKFHSVIAPDFSIFVDLPRAINVWNIYRNRWVSCFWQSHCIDVIPSASWGNVDSFDYCFDGLPERSIIAIGHPVIGKDKSYRRLFRLGVEKLIEKKEPTKLIVYGNRLDFDPGVEIHYYESKIQKLRAI